MVEKIEVRRDQINDVAHVVDDAVRRLKPSPNRAEIVLGLSQYLCVDFAFQLMKDPDVVKKAVEVIDARDAESPR